MVPIPENIKALAKAEKSAVGIPNQKYILRTLLAAAYCAF